MQSHIRKRAPRKSGGNRHGGSPRYIDIDCTWHEKNDKEWISFPAKSYEDKNGNTLWQPLIEFADGAGEARRQFQEHAVGAIHDFIDEQHSEVTYEQRRETET